MNSTLSPLPDQPRNIKWRRGLLIAVVLAFFPWVSFGVNALDTQPWFLLAGGVYLLVTMGTFQRGYSPIWLFMATAVLILVVLHGDDVMHTLRGISTYLAAGFSVLVFARYMRIDIRTRVRILTIVNLCWLLYPILQVTGVSEIYPLVLGRSSDDRGLTSLAAEPTFYGVFSLAMIAIFWLEREQWQLQFGETPTKFKTWMWLNGFQIVFLAWSSMGILLLLFAGVVALLVYRTRQAMLVILGTVFIAEFATFVIPASVFDVESRPIQLLKILLDDPSLLIVLDESINARFAAVYISMSEAARHFFLPQGLFAYASSSAEFVRTSPLVNSYQGNIIMSFIGCFLYELGFVSVLYFYIVVRAVNNRPTTRSKLFWLLTLGGVLLTAVPVGFPMVGYIIALLGVRRPAAATDRLAAAAAPAPLPGALPALA